MDTLSVDLISDLHLDRWPGVEMVYKPNPGVKIAVVAGDLQRNPELAGEALRAIRRVYPTVLFVDGNNEFRDPLMTDGDFDYSHTEDRLRRAIAAVNAEFGGGVHYLKDGPFIDKETGTAIIGRNGWWDHAADPRITVKQALAEQLMLMQNALNPKSAADSSLTAQQRAEIRDQLAKQKGATSAFAAAAPKRPVTLHDVGASRRQALRDYRALRKEERHLSFNHSVKTIAIVTHTVPHIPGTDLLDFGDGKWSPRTMSTMANMHMRKLTRRINDPFGKVGVYMFGHQHEGRDETIKDVRYISNPGGNPGEIYQQGALLSYRPLKVTLAARPTRKHGLKLG